MPRDDAGPAALAEQISFALRHARALLGFHRRHDRFLRFVDTHQKWLLVHLIADASAGVNRWNGAASSWVVERAEALSIASRKTTIAFVGQLTAYGYLERQHCRADRRIRLLSLSRETEEILADWLDLLKASMADATRSECWIAPVCHRDVAGALIVNPAYRKPPLDVRATHEMRGGWLAMADIVSRIDPADIGGERIAVHGFNARACARDHGLSKSTLYRLLRGGAEAGIMGTMAEARIPVFWLSGYHFHQYCRWIGWLAEAVRTAADGVGRGGQTAKRLPDRENSEASVIRAPATTFF